MIQIKDYDVTKVLNGELFDVYQLRLHMFKPNKDGDGGTGYNNRFYLCFDKEGNLIWQEHHKGD